MTRSRTRLAASSLAIAATALAALAGRALSAQDKYTVKAPDGCAFAEFRGYEDWQTVAVSHAGDLIEVILANPVMIAGRRARQRQAVPRRLQDGEYPLDREEERGGARADHGAG